MLLLLFRPYGSGTPPPVVVVADTHDGEKRDRDFKERHRRLRATIEAAFDGPLETETQEALAEFIAPQVADSIDRPAIERIVWERVWKRYDEVARRLEQLAQLAREQEADDEDDTLLLS